MKKQDGANPGISGVSREALVIPQAQAGMKIGLFGGSFNPPHRGHLLVAETALKRLQLHQVWWIVTPGNPLKDTTQLAPLHERIAACRSLAGDPRIRITAFEASYRVRYTADTLRLLTARRTGVDFVWLMGADNLRDFHHWQEWRTIAMTMPIAVIDRPGSTLSYLSSKMAKTFDYARVDESDAALLAGLPPPAWTFIHGPRSGLSSTAIRDGRTS